MKVTIVKRPGDDVSFESVCEREDLEVRVHQKAKGAWVAQLVCNPHFIGEGPSITEAIKMLVSALAGQTVEILPEKTKASGAYELGAKTNRYVGFPQIMFLNEEYDDYVF
jgi:hypothetical protein